MIRTLIPYAAALLAVGTVAQAALPVASLNRKTPVDFRMKFYPSSGPIVWPATTKPRPRPM